MSHTGNMLLSSLVKPPRLVPSDVTVIHSIIDNDLRTAPSFDQVLPRLVRVCAGNPLAIYNWNYDSRVVLQSALATGCFDLALSFLEGRPRACIMEPYAEFHGAWSEYHGSYTWQKLEAAVERCGIRVKGQAHRAASDAHSAREVLRHMARSDGESTVGMAWVKRLWSRLRRSDIMRIRRVDFVRHVADAYRAGLAAGRSERDISE